MKLFVTPARTRPRGPVDGPGASGPELLNARRRDGDAVPIPAHQMHRNGSGQQVLASSAVRFERRRRPGKSSKQQAMGGIVRPP
jgi:hypothetical protein